MKRILLPVVLSCAVVSAYALPDYEPFSYASGANLVGQTNPDGLTWTGAGPSGGNVAVTAGSLTVPGLAASIGNRIVFLAQVGPSARFPLQPGGLAISNGTVYFSFALQAANLSGLTTSGGYLAGFNDAVGTQEHCLR